MGVGGPVRGVPIYCSPWDVITFFALDKVVLLDLEVLAEISSSSADTEEEDRKNADEFFDRFILDLISQFRLGLVPETAPLTISVCHSLWYYLLSLF